MNSGISIKVIFSSFIFINFIQPGQSSDLDKVYKSDDNLFLQKGFSKRLSKKKPSNLSLNNNFKKILFKKYFLEENSESLFADLSKKPEEVVIQSDKQYEINNVIYAEGNVTVLFKGKSLGADKLIYDKLNKRIRAEGDVVLIMRNQIFKASQIEYSFVSEKGYLMDVQGSINTNTFVDDLLSNFSLSDSDKIKSFLELKKNEVVNTPGKIENWVFFTDKMFIEDNKWKSKKAVFTNDLLELKQVKLEVNSFEVISKEEKLRFKSSLNYLIFEEKVSIPFWYGDRTLTKSGEAGEFLNFENRWNIGYENLDKDGYFIGRKFNSIDLTDNFILDLEPQFLIQRSVNGSTKSFVKKNESITSDKVERDASFKDYFALKSQIKGNIKNWDLELEKNLNTFDFDIFSDAFRLKANLSKKINILNTNWNKNFYGVYRDRVWNGSLGEAEIYTGFGSKLSKENTWVVKGIKNTEYLSLGLAKIKAEALNSKNLISNLKGNLYYSLEQKFPIYTKAPKNKAIDISYRYIPEPITKGLSLNSKLEASYSFYEKGNHQEYLGLGLGPEMIFGNFKNKKFDYTRLALFPFYKFSRGDSVFKFDQNHEKFTLNISFDQQLFGPLLLKSSGKINLNSDSEDYGEFIESKISLNWKKRSYEFGLFYQPHNEIGGISFNVFGFK